MPRVSIITATYNYSSVLRLAIQSALDQTFQDFEYLVIGDGCTDDTAAIVESFQDPRLSYSNLPTNSGSQSLPNNRGLELASGEYIAYLGHDDLWSSNHLETLVRTLDETKAAWAHPLAVMIGPPGSGVHKLVGLVAPGSNPAHATFITSGVMHRRTLIAQVGSWREYRTLDIAPDREFHQRIVTSGAPLAHVDNLSVFKFPSAWRKNVYRDQPFQEQVEYLSRMQTEPDFIATELLAIVKSTESNAYEEWKARAGLPPDPTPTAPRGSQIESWRLYRGLHPNKLTPRSRLEVMKIRSRRAAADLTRPVRRALGRVPK